MIDTFHPGYIHTVSDRFRSGLEVDQIQCDSAQESRTGLGLFKPYWIDI